MNNLSTTNYQIRLKQIARDLKLQAFEGIVSILELIYLLRK